MTNILIVIPCYNSQEYISEAISSVKWQTYDDWHCVIVDDGSTDNSGELIDRETDGDNRFTVIHTENRGVAAARNTGISAVNSKYVIPLDADDKLLPNALYEFAKGWEENPDAALLVPQIYRYGEGCTPQVQTRAWKGYEHLKTTCTPSNTSCFKRSDWERIGGYRGGTMYEDWEFWIRLLYHNDKVINLPSVLVDYRIHENSRWHEAVKYHEREVSLIRHMNPRIFGEEVLVVIPYFAKGAQGRELELAIMGWQKFFKEPHKIIIVGDMPTFMDIPKGVKYIPCPQVKPIHGQYLPHLDHVYKFREVQNHFPNSKGFVYTCDDIYPTADITMADILYPKYPERGFMFPPFDWRKKPVDWYSDKGKTGELCQGEGLIPRNWICHLPVYYEWKRLFDIYNRYDCDHNSYIVENIYFNELYPDNPHAVNCLEFRDEVRTSEPAIRPVGSVKWITNANCGWSQKLEDILRRYYEKVED